MRAVVEGLDQRGTETERPVHRGLEIDLGRHVQVDVDGVLGRTRVIGALEHQPRLAGRHRVQPDVLLPPATDLDLEQRAPERCELLRVTAVDDHGIPTKVHGDECAPLPSGSGAPRGLPRQATGTPTSCCASECFVAVMVKATTAAAIARKAAPTQNAVV